MMKDIPLIDSLTHPTLTGRWLKSGYDAGFNTLAEQMAANGVERACAVGLDGVENYEHEAFLSKCRAYPKLFPVAGLNPEKCGCVSEKIASLREMGYRAVKLHPRFSGLIYSRPAAIIETIECAHANGMPVFLCTYHFTNAKNFPEEDQLVSLSRIIARVPDARIVLLHGGSIELLRYAEFARSNPNILIDLSFTLEKYEGSSIDLDIAYLFRTFDRRISIGSDFPEFSLATLRRRFEQFANQITGEKAENIAFRNLQNFLGLENQG